MRLPSVTGWMFVALSLGIWGCTSKETRDDETPQALYKAAETAAEKGGLFGARDCLGAEKRMRKLRQRYPYHALTVEGDLVLAECAFKDGRPTEAIARWQSVLRLNPGHPKTPEIRFKIAQAYMSMAEAYDRDQGPVMQALTQANTVIREHPNAAVADKALALRDEARTVLAKRELYVARHYRRQGELLAARDRYRELLADYGDLKLAQEARTELNRVERRLGLATAKSPEAKPNGP